MLRAIRADYASVQTVRLSSVSWHMGHVRRKPMLLRGVLSLSSLPHK